MREPDGFSLPNPPRDSRTFETKNGKANFFVHPLPKDEVPDGKFMMMTTRTHDQFNTTVYGLEDRYRGIKLGRRVVLMNVHANVEHLLPPLVSFGSKSYIIKNDFKPRR